MTTLNQLRAAIEDAEDTGQTIPCRVYNADEWFGDENTRRIAATRCAACPITWICGDYATTAKEPAGVWGGNDHGAGIGHRTYKHTPSHCAHPDCDRTAKALGYCGTHYAAARRAAGLGASA